MPRTMIMAAAVMALTLSLPPAWADDPAPAKQLLAQQGPDLWRGSKLIGVNIYGPDDKKVGDISDILTDHDGKAAYVIVGVGGFLGIGEKDIAIPFGQVAFKEEPLRPAPVPVTPGANPDGSAAGGGMAPGTSVGLGSPPQPGAGTTTTAAPAQPPVVVQRPTAYPDHGIISLTADQLKEAPAFQYAK